VIDSNPAVVGQTVTITATVGSTAPGIPSGNVNFLDNGVVIGTGVLNFRTATFSATFDTTPHSITAEYQGDTTFAPSNSGAIAERILDFTIIPGSATSATVTAGQTANYSLQFQLNGGLASDQITISLTCTGAPARATCSGPGTPVVVSAAQNASVQIAVTTTANGLALPPASAQPRIPRNLLPVIAGLAVLSFLLSLALAQRRIEFGAGKPAWRFAHALPVLVLFVAIAVVSGCGGGGGAGTPPPTPTPTPIPSPTPTPTPAANGTPPGNYTLTVTAQAGTGTPQIQHLTLVVK
jgi:hypothetical protein